MAEMIATPKVFDFSNGGLVDNLITDEVIIKAPPKFIQSERIRRLAQYSRDLAISGKRKLGWAANSVGDHACWIDIGPFPEKDQMPSRVNGYEASGESWGRDYAFLVDHFPVEIHPDERIIGEIHWEMHMVRQYEWPAAVRELEKEAWAMGAGGISSGHTCPDLAIGLTQGFGGILERIKASRAHYLRLDNQPKAAYLHGLEMICESVIRFIQRHANKALQLAAAESDPWQKATYLRAAECCAHIATQPPRTYYEGVQWIHFAVMMDRVVGHGNGYGRLDLYLIDLYRKSKAAGELSDEEAREYLAEMFLKLRGHFFSMGGRDANLKDATNEMSFVVLEAYDLIGDYNNLGVMWHPDINPEFYNYACDVLARHGESIPVLVNYDLMYEAELRSGIPHEDAWKVVYSGCQWFCIPGKEYCDQDVNSLILLKPMQRTISAAIARGIADFETFYTLFEDEITVTARWLQDWNNAQYELLGSLWPEMYTSMLSHGPIERGIDMVDNRGVDYQFSSVNILGIPNVADAFHAIKKLVFEQKRYTLAEVQEATDTNWAGREPMRQRFLNQDKWMRSLCASPNRWRKSWGAWSTCGARSSGLRCFTSRATSTPSCTVPPPMAAWRRNIWRMASTPRWAATSKGYSPPPIPSPRWISANSRAARCRWNCNPSSSTARKKFGSTSAIFPKCSSRRAASRSISTSWI
jgi:formate C-acetyltransferase